MRQLQAVLLISEIFSERIRYEYLAVAKRSHILKQTCSFELQVCLSKELISSLA